MNIPWPKSTDVGVGTSRGYAEIALTDLIENVEDLSDYDRTLVFDALADRYCRHCGRVLGNGMPTFCNCTNNE